jgi:putative MATE family efflux protein
MKKYDGNLAFSNRDLLRLIVPLIIEQFLNSFIGLVDSMMVSGEGEAAVSGISLVDNVNLLIINLFSALATGGAVIIGQYLGREDREKANKSVEQLYIVVSSLSILVMAFLYIIKNFILTVVFGTIAEDVYRNANTYFLIVTASIPFVAIYNCGAAVFRTMGNSKISMTASAGMNVIHIAGNAIMIYGFGMGVAGAAVSTLLSRIAAAAFITLLLRNQHLTVHFGEKISFRVEGQYAKRILHIGVPSGFENSIFQLGKIMILNLVATFGTSGITANAVGSTVSAFQNLPASSIGLALLTIVSRCIGMGDYKQARYYTRKMMMVAYGIMAIYNGLFALLTPNILQFYHLPDNTYQLTLSILLLSAAFSATVWPSAFSLPNALRAAGDVKFTMVVSITSMWIFRFGFSYVFGLFLHMGVFGTWLAMMLDWVARTAAFWLRYKGDKWQKKKVI